MHGRGKPGPTMNASQILRSAARIESMAGDLYAGLAVTFSHQPFLREMFELLAQEEAQHAMGRRMLRPEVDGEVADGGFGHGFAFSSPGSMNSVPSHGERKSKLRNSWLSFTGS